MARNPELAEVSRLAERMYKLLGSADLADYDDAKKLKAKAIPLIEGLKSEADRVGLNQFMQGQLRELEYRIKLACGRTRPKDGFPRQQQIVWAIGHARELKNPEYDGSAE